MADVDNLAERLQSYGGQLQGELAGWPTFVPVEPTGLGVPLLLLRTRLGRWLGAGRRPSIAWLAGAVLAIVIGVGALVALTGEGADDSAVVPAASAASAAPSDAPGDAVLAVDTSEASEAEAPELDMSDVSETTREPDADSTVQAAADPDGETESSGARGDDATGDDATGDDSALSVRCIDGEPAGDLCKIVSAPVTLPGELECLTSSGLVEDETGCFRVDEATAACPAGASLQQQTCVRAVAQPTTSAPTCEVGELDGDRCLRDVEGTFGCPTGQFRDEQCVIQGPAPEGGALVCSVGDPDRPADRCVAYSDVDCGDLVAVPGGCLQAGSVREVVTCSSGSIQTSRRCEPTNGCEQAYNKTIGPCGSAPTVELVCSITGAMISAGAECSTVVAGVCRTGILQGDRCAEERPLSVSAAQCPAEWTLVGLSCVRYDAPTLQCPEGAVPAESACVIVTPARTSTVTCPSGTNLVAGSCVQASPAALSCRAGTLVGSECRIPVEVAPRIGCLEGAVRVFDTCVRYVPATET